MNNIFHNGQTNPKGLAFDDISLIPAEWSGIASRKEVDTSVTLCGQKLNLGIVSSNMDSVYSPKLSQEVLKAGGISVVHRFCDIQTNIDLFQEGWFINYENQKPWVSIGLGSNELERAEALINSGAETIVIDVANAASDSVVRQFLALKELFNVQIIVGNFGTKAQIETFVEKAGKIPNSFKVNVGSGSACTTRIQTGVGLPSVTTLLECVETGYPIIQDGGIRNSGDFAKSIALGAKAVMVGRLFAATLESGAETAKYKDVITGYVVEKGRQVDLFENIYFRQYDRAITEQVATHKKYRGSASQSSYKTQNKEASFRSPEGDEYIIPITGTVQDLMQNLEGGLRSSMSYLNARTIEEFQKNAKWIEVSTSSLLESRPHGKDLK